MVFRKVVGERATARVAIPVAEVDLADKCVERADTSGRFPDV